MAVVITDKQLQQYSHNRLRDYMDDMQRIATDGPNGTDRDVQIVRMVLYVMLGDLRATPEIER